MKDTTPYTGKSKITSLALIFIVGNEMECYLHTNFSYSLHNYITFGILILVTTVSEKDNLEETRSVCILCIPSFLPLRVEL